MKSNFARRWKGAMITAYILSLPTSYLTAQENLVLHYNRPAEFFEEALVIGNGTMGAILYGGTDKDVLYLNDITLWTGEPDRKVTSTTVDAKMTVPAFLIKAQQRSHTCSAQERIAGK